jgi:hypothetical protein
MDIVIERTNKWKGSRGKVLKAERNGLSGAFDAVAFRGMILYVTAHQFPAPRAFQEWVPLET